jgi:hypothetical protein
MTAIMNVVKVRKPESEDIPMRKLLLLAFISTITTMGCNSLSGPKANRSGRGAPDPLLSPDLDEQQRYGRGRYSYPEDDRTIAPPGFSGRSTPSGR